MIENTFPSQTQCHAVFTAIIAVFKNILAERKEM
jgi:hypothetical protein